jgi:hypothetical protein
MRPIDGSGAKRLPSNISATPSKPRKKLRRSESGESSRTPNLPPKPPGRTGATLYVGPSSPQSMNALKGAWENVEDTLFDAPLQDVADLGREYIESHLARADVTRAVQRVAPQLKAAAQRLSPDQAARWPTFDQYADAVRLVHAFLHVHAPDPDQVGEPDYDALCRQGKSLTDAFTRLGRSLSREEDAAARPLIKVIVQRWTAYRHHLQRWQQHPLPATWKLPAQRLELSEQEVHAVLIDPDARIMNWQNLAGLYTGLLTSLCFSPRETGLALDVLKDIHSRLVDILPNDKAYLDEVLDVEEFKRQESHNVLDNAALFRACAVTGSLLPRHIPNKANYREFENAGYPVHALPTCIIHTYEAVLIAYNVDRQLRLRDAIPTIFSDGVAWERNNFARALKNSRGKQPRTDAWFDKHWDNTPGPNLQLRHAQALSALLLSGTEWTSEALPETLALAPTQVADASKTLHTLARLVLAGQHLERMCRRFDIDCNPSDVAAFQQRMLESTDKRVDIPLILANATIDEFIEIGLKRRRFPERKDVAEACMHDLLHDVGELTGERAEAVRADLTQQFAQALVKPPQHDAMGRDYPHWQRRLESLARDFTRLTNIDLQVHGGYYLFKQQEAATNGGTPDAPA